MDNLFVIVPFIFLSHESVPLDRKLFMTALKIEYILISSFFLNFNIVSHYITWAGLVLAV